MATRQKRILFVHDDNPSDPLSSFINQDLLFLRQWYEVEVLSLYPYKHAHLSTFASPAVWKAVASCDAVFSWFGWNAPAIIMAGLLGKPSVVVAGGADVTAVPEIGYGISRKRSKDRVIATILAAGYRQASRVLLFSEASRKDFVNLPGVQAAKGETLYLGIDSEHFNPAGAKLPQVLTVSYISDSSLRRKGLLTFVEVARTLSGVKFRIGGLVNQQSALDELLRDAPSNVEFLGYLNDNQLLDEYRKASVYVQLSHHEGFGLAIAEAMACEAVPVVTGRGSIPEVVGDTGLYVPVDDPAAAAEAIKLALASVATLGRSARKRIVTKFQPAAREERIRAIMEELLQ